MRLKAFHNPLPVDLRKGGARACILQHGKLILRKYLEGINSTFYSNSEIVIVVHENSPEPWDAKTSAN